MLSKISCLLGNMIEDIIFCLFFKLCLVLLGTPSYKSYSELIFKKYVRYVGYHLMQKEIGSRLIQWCMLFWSKGKLKILILIFFHKNKFQLLYFKKWTLLVRWKTERKGNENENEMKRKWNPTCKRFIFWSHFIISFWWKNSKMQAE